MSKNIHSTTIIEDGADIHPSVKIGPYSIIKKNVSIGENTIIGSHVVIDGVTTIGKNNHIFLIIVLVKPLRIKNIIRKKQN